MTPSPQRGKTASPQLGKADAPRCSSLQPDGSGRYAPSPSGELHLGNLRTALLAWALARHDGLRFQIRIENLDERSRAEYELSQLRDLEALGLDWDGAVLRQSERLEVYQHIASQLQEQGSLYECYCSRKELAAAASAPHGAPGVYQGTCRELTEGERELKRESLIARTGRAPALRLRADVQELKVHDRFCGDYAGAVDDFVILRGDGVPSYNFVSVVDDAMTGVTQIVRGDDLLPSTPRQVYLQQLLGYERPEYAHVPLVLNAQGVRLAKRDGAVTLKQLAAVGYGVSQVFEWIAASLGYPGRANAQEFLADFDPDRVPREPWVFVPPESS